MGRKERLRETDNVEHVPRSLVVSFRDSLLFLWKAFKEMDSKVVSAQDVNLESGLFFLFKGPEATGLLLAGHLK